MEGFAEGGTRMAQIALAITSNREDAEDAWLFG
jgi:hypothetical protein